MLPVAQRRAIEMQVTDEIAVPIPSGSFLQATKAGQQAITKEIVEATSSRRHILDLYAGCGGYSFVMAAYARVHAVEGDASMTSTILNTARKYNLSSQVTAEARDLVKQPFQVKDLNKYDAVVINPPRNGAKAQAEFLAKSKVPVVAMVSCNPVTFATDAKILAEGGYTLKRAVPIDQFVWSSHLELVARFEK
jgi:23S rRNA (uracil1939-C5)-methyltransferase